MILIYGNPETVACQATHLKSSSTAVKEAFWKSSSKCSARQHWIWKKKKGLKVLWLNHLMSILSLSFGIGAKFSWTFLTDQKRPNFSHNAILTKCVVTAFWQNLRYFYIFFQTAVFIWQKYSRFQLRQQHYTTFEHQFPLKITNNNYNKKYNTITIIYT